MVEKLSQIPKIAQTFLYRLYFCFYKLLKLVLLIKLSEFGSYTQLESPQTYHVSLNFIKRFIDFVGFDYVTDIMF